MDILIPEPILYGVITGRLVPYQRQTQRQRHNRYEDSKSRIRAAMIDAKGPGRHQIPYIKSPYKFSLTVCVPLTRAKKIPRNAGDLDNFVKAFLDAANGTIVEDDSLYHCLGINARVVPCPSDEGWSFRWAFFLA